MNKNNQQPGIAVLPESRIAEIYREKFNSAPGAARQAPANVPPLVIAFGQAIAEDAIAESRRTAGGDAETLTGRTVSVDVSTGDEDGGNRIFAELTGETGSDGATLLAYEVSRNFAAPVSPPDGAMPEPEFSVDDPDLNALLNAAANWGAGKPQNMDTGMYLADLIETVEKRLAAQPAEVAPDGAMPEEVMRALIGLRDGWATRVDACKALDVLATHPTEGSALLACVACENKPSQENNPCAVCGLGSAQVARPDQDQAHVMPPTRGTDSQQDATERAFDMLYGEVMNIPCQKVPVFPFVSGPNATEQLRAYKEGHRDARHAAAELVTEFASRFRAQGGSTQGQQVQAPERSDTPAPAYKFPTFADWLASPISGAGDLRQYANLAFDAAREVVGGDKQGAQGEKA